MFSCLRPHAPLAPFQVLAVEVCETPPPTFDLDNVELLASDNYYRDRDTTTSFHQPSTVVVFGVTEQGASVTVRVAGFRPFCFVEVNDTWTPDRIQLELSRLRMNTTVTWVTRKRAYGWVPSATDPRVPRDFQFARVEFPNAWTMKVAARRLAELATPPDVSEVQVSVTEKFLASHNLHAAGWAEVTTARVVPRTARTTCAMHEVTCDVGQLQPVDRQAVAPLVIASVDIEARSHDYVSFPDPAVAGNEIIYIGTTFWVYGDTEPRLRVMQVLGECDPGPDNMVVQSFDTEYDLLVGWRDLMALHTDPDMVVSYNGTGFDFAYMARRMEFLQKHLRHAATRFNALGRFLLVPHPLYTRELTSAAKGQNELSWFPQPGRVQLDLFMYVKDSQKLSSYKLDTVAAMFLGDGVGKVVLSHPGWLSQLVATATPAVCAVAAGVGVDVTAHMAAAATAAAAENVAEVAAATTAARDAVQHAMQSANEVDAAVTAAELAVIMQPLLDATGDNNYRKLFRLYDAGAAARAAIAEYCQVDCDLVVMLLDRLNVVVNTLQMSLVCNTLPNDVANRGQQIKTFNLIARFAQQRGYVMNWRDPGWDPTAEYEGATVLEPTPGYYKVPVNVLDFASLYPSIMRAYNLCFSSLVLDEEYANLPGVRYERFVIAGREWVFQQESPGLLPLILADLLGARRGKKREMKKYAKGSLDYRLCDGAQLALKVSCNSVYGFTGVLLNGMFPCMPVAVATTFCGRRLIFRTKEYMEKHYGATVCYGDTDSVFVIFPGVTTVAEAMRLSDEAAAAVSATFPDVVELENEASIVPFLLVGKKTYAGLKYEGNPDGPPSMYTKGLAVVRRDNCEYVRDVMNDVLNLTMTHADPDAAYARVQRAVDDLVAGKVPLSKLQITNSLKKEESYANPAQPQLTVVRKMRERRAFDVPRCGDRVAYVILADASKPRVSDRAEDPAWVAAHNLRVDVEYYLNNQMLSRLKMVVDPLPVPSIDTMFEVAVENARARALGLDQTAITRFCSSRGRPNTTPPLPVSRKRGRPKETNKNVPSLMDFSRKRGRPKETNKNVPSLMDFMKK